jgi:hypothetical protein
MQSKRHYRFRMNLRLYSDGKPLAGLAETLKFPREHLHIKGEPMIFTALWPAGWPKAIMSRSWKRLPTT